MNFIQLYQKSNSSLDQLCGNAIESFVEEVRGDIVLVDTGLKGRTTCFRKEISKVSQVQIGTQTVLGIEHVEIAGESKFILPNNLQRIWKQKFVWTELAKVWRSSKNRIRGFILNSVNGGYAVAIAGHIAFLPRSLRRDRKMFRSQWRSFSILNMNAKIGNIVVKEIGDIKSGFSKKHTSLSFPKSFHYQFVSNSKPLLTKKHSSWLKPSVQHHLHHKVVSTKTDS